MTRRVRFFTLLTVLLLAPTGASAFCGFYIEGAGQDLYNDATQVVLMRRGRTTIMSLQNNYQGPPSDFAMVVPVPVVLQRENVRTLPRDVFDRIDQLAAPRLVEYWEQNPCQQRAEIDDLLSGALGGGGSGYGRGAGAMRARDHGVTVAARFEVGEYDIVILSAEHSTGLEAWLRQERYHIPSGAAAALRPYVQAGTKFFVARVDASRLTFRNGQAQLSPLRVHYESEQLTLPIRLGMLNARGPQDLIVHVLGEGRFEVANRSNVTIPTNLRVRDNVRSDFGRFYASLFDATVRANPGAVVTEYAWSPTSCDPCPGPTLTPSDIATLGGDVAYNLPGAGAGANVQPTGPVVVPGQFLSFTQPLETSEEMRQPLRRVLRARSRMFDVCVRRTAGRGGVPPSGAAVGRLVFDIGADGGVSSPQVAGLPGSMGACVRSMTQRLRFPTPRAGTSAHVRIGLHARWSAATVARGFGSGMTLSRLHFRYTASDAPDDLVFRQANGIIGGRGMPDQRGAMNPQVQPQPPSGNSFFQARYAILHPWRGRLSCQNPRRGVWGGPPNGSAAGVRAASDLGEVRNRRFRLSRAVVGDVPGLSLRSRRRRGGSRKAPIRKGPNAKRVR